MGLHPLMNRESKARYFKKYYDENGEKIKAKKREYSKKNKEKLNEQTLQWHKRNPIRSLLTSARNRAKRYGLPFSLVLEDITIPTVCPVLGIPLMVKQGKRTDNTPSLDRIIPEKGYVKGNVDIISWRANRLKCDATPEEIEKLYEYVRKRLTKP